MKKDIMNIQDILKRGFKALTKELGAAGAIRFIQQYDQGHGDYTKERQKWASKLTSEDIFAQVKKIKHKKKK